MTFWDFTLADVVVGIGVLSTIVFYLISYRKKYSGPTREEFLSLKKIYEEHVKKDSDQFGSIDNQLEQIEINTAVMAERIETLKIDLKEQTAELKKDIRESLKDLKEDIRNK